MRLYIIVITLFAFCLSEAFGQSGSIAGTVTGADNNSPLAGASILVVGRSESGAPVFLQSSTAKDGSFLVSKVPGGSYTVCARYKSPFTGGSRKDFWASRAFVAEEIAYLDSCDWSIAQPPKTTVATGQVSTAVRLPRGVNVSVFVDDPANLLDSATDSGASLQISVLDGSGNVKSALPLQDNANGLRRFGATLPASGSFSLDVQIRGANLVASSGGATYPASFRLPVQTTNRSVLAGQFRVQK